MPKSVKELSAEEVRQALAAIRIERQKRYEYNKRYRDEHPLNDQAKQKRREYHREYQARRKALENAVIAKATELGLLPKTE